MAAFDEIALIEERINEITKEIKQRRINLLALNKNLPVVQGKIERVQSNLTFVKNTLKGMREKTDVVQIGEWRELRNLEVKNESLLVPLQEEEALTKSKIKEQEREIQLFEQEQKALNKRLESDFGQIVQFTGGKNGSG